MTAIGTHKSPVHPLAFAAFLASLIAIVVAFYGSIAAEKRIANSPLNVARNTTVTDGGASEAAAFIVPFVLGIAAAVAGRVA